MRARGHGHLVFAPSVVCIKFLYSPRISSSVVARERADAVPFDWVIPWCV